MSIFFSMKEIRYVMRGRMPEVKRGLLGRQPRVQVERFWWRECAVSLSLVPPVWLGTHRLADYMQILEEEGQELWLAPELEGYFPGYRQPLPEPELAAFLLQQQPFRETLVILTGEESWWEESFLEDIFSDLNGLYLVGKGQGEGTDRFLEWLCEQSGLAACVTDRMPETDGRKTAVVDLCRSNRMSCRKIAPGSLYLDFTSDPEKCRIFKAKRRDVSYISARNYLDTAFKARYNAM